MLFRRRFSASLLFVLWETATIFCSEQRKLDELSKTFRRYLTAINTFLDPYVDFEDKCRWLHEINFLADDRVFQGTEPTEDGKVVRGYPLDCRRAIYERVSRYTKTVRHYKKSRECISTMQDLLMEMYCEYKTYLAIIVAVIFFVIIALVSYICENNNLKKCLKKAIEEQKTLREKLSESEMFHNIQETL